jgi:hypothetical protein
MRIALTTTLTLALAALVLAQDAADPAELVRKLGHDDYVVREQATQDLIEMGEDAIPALEKALQSDDLEVRLRAGRALRAIRGAGEGAQAKREQTDDSEAGGAAPGGAAPARPGASSVSIQVMPDGVKVTVVERTDGKETRKEYTAANMEELLREHPELKRYVGGFRMRVGPANDDPFDMDSFWRDWNKDAEEHFRRLRQDTARDMEKLRKLMEALRQNGQGGMLGERPVPEQSLLGVRAQRPDAVLDAQLQLRGQGLVVHAIAPDGIAAKLGIQRFDVLVKLGGRTIRSGEDVAAVLESRNADDPLEAVVIRGASPVQLQLAK